MMCNLTSPNEMYAGETCPSIYGVWKCIYGTSWIHTLKAFVETPCFCWAPAAFAPAPGDPGVTSGTSVLLALEVNSAAVGPAFTI